MKLAWLTIVGLGYVALALWCAISPKTTAASVGFSLIPGSGESEYLVVYTGLQLALGLLFLSPWLRPTQLDWALQGCWLIHVCLVASRTISFQLFHGISRTTWVLAALEWIIFLGTSALIARRV